MSSGHSQQVLAHWGRSGGLTDTDLCSCDVGICPEKFQPNQIDFMTHKD